MASRCVDGGGIYISCRRASNAGSNAALLAATGLQGEGLITGGCIHWMEHWNLCWRWSTGRSMPLTFVANREAFCAARADTGSKAVGSAALSRCTGTSTSSDCSRPLPPLPSVAHPCRSSQRLLAPQGQTGGSTRQLDRPCRLLVASAARSQLCAVIRAEVRMGRPPHARRRDQQQEQPGHPALAAGGRGVCCCRSMVQRRVHGSVAGQQKLRVRKGKVERVTTGCCWSRGVPRRGAGFPPFPARLLATKCVPATSSSATDFGLTLVSTFTAFAAARPAHAAYAPTPRLEPQSTYLGARPSSPTYQRRAVARSTKLCGACCSL